ncbi:MAG TPA: hypothetical protein VES95_02275, partial [Dermatophilaceae bacterium]|nr:hypothetical protein [Dermatophilaceae bacterium]
MDSQRLHLRSTVVVDQSLLDPPELPPVDPLFELEVPAGAEARIVANTLVVAGGTTRGYTLTLVGETVTGAGPGALSVELVNQTAPRAFTGRPGLGLRVVASRLVGGA